MLVLSRKKSEYLLIDGGIKVTVVGIRGDNVRLGIDAPKEVAVLRGELVDRRTKEPDSPQINDIGGEG